MKNIKETIIICSITTLGLGLYFNKSNKNTSNTDLLEIENIAFASGEIGIGIPFGKACHRNRCTLRLFPKGTCRYDGQCH